MQFKDFAKNYKLSMTKETGDSANKFTSTHTQIAYMAYLAGQSFQAGDIIKVLDENHIINHIDSQRLREGFEVPPFMELIAIQPLPEPDQIEEPAQLDF